jgi:AbrB family looped-hinge helix DNA binding protein
MTLELTITAKGQVTLRQKVLDHLGLKPGDKVGVEILPDGRVELSAASTKPGIATLRGMLRLPGRKVMTLQEMQEAIEGGDPE